MERLDKDWLTKDNTDFEYKKYILLDYLQRVSNQFKENKIYPYLSDCIEEFRSLKDLLEQKDKLTPKELTSIDFKNMELIYTTIEDDIFVEIQKLINPNFKLEENFKKTSGKNFNKKKRSFKNNSSKTNYRFNKRKKFKTDKTD